MSMTTPTTKMMRRRARRRLCVNSSPSETRTQHTIPTKRRIHMLVPYVYFRPFMIIAQPDLLLSNRRKRRRRNRLCQTSQPSSPTSLLDHPDRRPPLRRNHLSQVFPPPHPRLIQIIVPHHLPPGLQYPTMAVTRSSRSVPRAPRRPNQNPSTGSLGPPAHSRKAAHQSSMDPPPR